MTESATRSAEDRRRKTGRAITRAARELALAHGLDGFTMEQLADRAGVSRRTLFNYFPGKYDALLGGGASLDPSFVETFRAGGPTGDLVEDLLVLADEVLAEREDGPDDMALGQQVLASCPPLIAHACAGLDAALADLTDHLAARPGEHLGERTARTLLATLIALGHLTIDEYVESGGATPPADLLRHHVADLRRLLT